MPSGGDRLDDYARALEIFEAHLARRRTGDAESEDELLAAHADLAELLRAMLAGEQSATASLDAGVPVATWRGLPDEQQDFGPYRIDRLLGQGGMGSVFLATHRELGRHVALKLIRPERLFSMSAKERFWREAKAVSRLDHPNICPVYDVGEVDGLPYMAMRYIEGQSLSSMISTAQESGTATMIDSGAQPAQESAPATGTSPTTRKDIHRVIRLIEDVARALHHAHERGVIHRDIKPGNIMVDLDDRPMVLDFGLAREEQSTDAPITMTGDLPGTPLYMSPEQISPQNRPADRTTDVYSLGATMYECLTLRRMFQATTTRDLFENILRSDPTPATRINPKSCM